MPWYPLVGHAVGRTLPVHNLEPGLWEAWRGYVVAWWCWDDSPDYKLPLLGRQCSSGSEQARLVKTVKVHMPIAKWDMDQTVGSLHLWGNPWRPVRKAQGGTTMEGRPMS